VGGSKISALGASCPRFLVRTVRSVLLSLFLCVPPPLCVAFLSGLPAMWAGRLLSGAYQLLMLVLW
jgi:hypothetical protein